LCSSFELLRGRAVWPRVIGASGASLLVEYMHDRLQPREEEAWPLSHVF
jgi:hypothetical protein